MSSQLFWIVKVYSEGRWYTVGISDTAHEAKAQARWDVHTIAGITQAEVVNPDGQVIAVYKKDKKRRGRSREEDIGGE